MLNFLNSNFKLKVKEKCFNKNNIKMKIENVVLCFTQIICELFIKLFTSITTKNTYFT